MRRMKRSRRQHDPLGHQALDATLAKTCGDKADKLMRDLVGKDVPVHDYGVDSLNQWFNQIFPGLFATSDPDNAAKAVVFINNTILTKHSAIIPISVMPLNVMEIFKRQKRIMKWLFC